MMQSPDGDLIDCVLSHLQPAFDHPQLKGMKPLVICSEKKTFIFTFFFIVINRVGRTTFLIF